MRIRKHWKPPSPPPSSVSSSHNLLPHEIEPNVSSAVVHTCATWGTFFWACQLSDAPDEQSDNRGTLRKRRELKTAEFAEGIMASLTHNQDERPGLKQQKVCNFFIKKSCRMERPKSTCNQMTQIEGQAIGPHTTSRPYPRKLLRACRTKKSHLVSNLMWKAMRRGRREAERLSKAIW